jgi:hypothetical protein
MVISVSDIRKNLRRAGRVARYQKRRTVDAQMSFEEFLRSTAGGTPPAGLAGPLLALWHDVRGEWDTAHALAQAAGGVDGAWVHAYLHRKEGDAMNAGYWYRRAGRAAAGGDLRAEWEAIARALLARGG